MKRELRYKYFAAALVVLSNMTDKVARADVVVTKENAAEIGLDFERLKNVLVARGLEYQPEAIILENIYSEEQQVDLKTLEGISFTVPFDSICTGVSGQPRNVT